MRSFVLSLLALCATVACVSGRRAINHERVLKHVVPCFAQGLNNCHSHDWEAGVETPEHTPLRLVIAVATASIDSCDAQLKRVSYPNSAHYGQYLTLEEYGEKFSKPESTEAVTRWLDTHELQGYYDLTVNGDYIVVEAPAGKLNALLSTRFHSFRSAEKGKTIHRTLRYSLPKHLEEHIEVIAHTTDFPATKIPTSVSQSVPLDASSTSSSIWHQYDAVTPAFLNEFYNINSNDASSSKHCLFEALGQSFSSVDLETFQNEFDLPNDPIDRVVGPNHGGECVTSYNQCGEANLDVQYMQAIAQNANAWVWTIEPEIQNIFITYAYAAANHTNPPDVTSISYAGIEAEEDTSLQMRFNKAACGLGTRGKTILVASGDDGVASFAARGNPSECGYNPGYPTNSPYVTVVGATQGPESGDDEIACSSSTGGVITTGGGFSNLFATPDWQQDAVSNYLANGVNVPTTSDFASTGRAYPDVAALGFNYPVVLGGNFLLESGTSASTPVFAAMLSVINTQRAANGNPTVGFVNPAIYSAPAGTWNDITSGENNCAAESGYSYETCCSEGFTAGPGWDPVTGNGSPDFAQLSSYLANM